jgi:hypothetical protein
VSDHTSVFEELNIHWTTVTYKDVGVMGWVMTDPESSYMQVIRPIFEAKNVLHADNWCALAPCVATEALRQLAGVIKDHCGEPELDGGRHYSALVRYCLEEYTAGLLQTPFARRFKDMSDADIDETLRSFRLENCVVNEEFVNVLKRHMLPV